MEGRAARAAAWSCTDRCAYTPRVSVGVECRARFDTLADGTPYTAIVRRRCLDCGQVRIDKEYA
jgi:hypothetical protein